MSINIFYAPSAQRSLNPSDQGWAAGGGSVTGGAAAQPDAECFFILSFGYIYIMIMINGCLKLTFMTSTNVLQMFCDSQKWPQETNSAVAVVGKVSFDI